MMRVRSMEEISHISMTRQKWVVVSQDAPDRYVTDERWMHLHPEYKDFGVACLTEAAGMRCIVTQASWAGDILWYELLLPEPVTIEMLGIQKTFRFLHISADYVTIEDSGFLEAK